MLKNLTRKKISENSFKYNFHFYQFSSLLEQNGYFFGNFYFTQQYKL